VRIGKDPYLGAHIASDLKHLLLGVYWGIVVEQLFQGAGLILES
jgi:hypothetical protein